MEDYGKGVYYSGIALFAGGLAGYFLSKKNRLRNSILMAIIALFASAYLYRIGEVKKLDNADNEGNGGNGDNGGNGGNGGNGDFSPNDEYSPIDENDGNTWNDGSTDGSGSVSENTDVYNPNNGRLDGLVRTIRPAKEVFIR